MERRKENRLILLIGILLFVGCMSIKWWVRNNMMTLDPIKVNDFVWIQYLRHFCDYLEVRNGLVAIGRIFALISLSLTFLLKMFSTKQRNQLVITISATMIICVVFLQIFTTPVGGSEFFSFIIQIAVYGFIYTVDEMDEYFQNSIAKVAFMFYFVGSVGNIISANFVGWVTDYIYILPTMNFEYIYNIEDCLIGLGSTGLGVFTVYYTIKTVIQKIRMR